MCKDDLCNCSGHKRQLYYRDKMVVTQLVVGAFDKEHQAKILSEMAHLHSLEDKLDRLCVLEKSESSSTTISGQIQSTAGVKVVECWQVHPCMIECYNCNEAGHVRYCCTMHKTEVKVWRPR